MNTKKKEDAWARAMRRAAVLGLVALGLAAAAAFATEKLVDATLFASTDEHYRWSEGSIITLDEAAGGGPGDHLLMAVTVFGMGGHDNTEAEIVAFHSYDGGLTWPSLEEAAVLQGNVGEENTMSPALLKLANGDLLCFVDVKNSIRDCGPWVKRSTDGGKTWGELKRLPYEGYGGVGSDRALQIGSGRVLLPCWVSLDELKSTRVCVFYSDDRGQTWSKSPLVTTPKGTTGRKTDPAAEEPMIIELEDGRLMMIMRVYLKSIYKCYSNDGGATWSEPVSSGIPSPGSMATIRRLPNGDILLIWNWAQVEDIEGPWPRNFISAAISKDEGENFSFVRHLDGATDFEGKITMANVAFAADDKVVITYSKSMTKKNAYNWRLQVIPLQWFYEGDTTQVYGTKYLPTLEAELAALKQGDSAGSALDPRTPSPDERKAAMAKLAQFVAQDGADKDLVAAYRFEAGAGPFAFDTSAGANDLAVHPADAALAWAEGKAGQALAFDGTSGYLAASDSASLHFPAGQFSVEAWIYPTANKKCALIASKEHVFEVGLLDGRLKAAVMSGGNWGPGWVGDTAIPLDTWSHVAVTFDGRALRFYVDGKQTGEAARLCKMDVTNEPLVVGGCTHIRDPVFAGRIDELRIWQSVRYEPEGNPGMPSAEGAPRRVGRTHQLFIDDALIAENSGLERVVNRPARWHENPVLTYESPWEGNCVITWGSVLYDEDEKRFKVWYEVYKKFPEHDDGTLVCYATSADGIHWEKPELGIIDYLGSKANNIVLWVKEGSIDAPTVLRVPDPTPDLRYRMYFHGSNPSGIRTATSADGVHWDVRDGVVIEAGDRNTACYDPVRRKYRVITRIPGRGLRTCGLWGSDDGERFTHVGELLAPDENDPEQTEFYGMIDFDYAGLRLGFLEMFYIPTRTLNTQLAYSRDGIAWHRACHRQTFLDHGPPGSWDQTWVTPSHNAPIRVGDRLYVFYQGRQTLHWAEKPYGHIGSVGLAFLRPDGFVSLDAQWDEGTVTTAPLVLEGAALHLNAFARPGYVLAEIVDLDGKPLDGFTRADGAPLEMADALDYAVAWRGGRDLAPLHGQPVRVRFYVRGAKLYSFWVE